VHGFTPGPDVSPNRALVEALYCPEHGFRPETAVWVCRDLRDEGGYASAHAAWILAIAVEQGCVSRQLTCLDHVRDELLAALRREEPLGTTAAVDLHAERILFGRMAGAPPDLLRPPIERLLAVQRPDGAFADPADGWAATHATLAATWALAQAADP
jgi:hypothetical protein